MGDHYVTRGYLRAWERDELLWVHDRKTGKTFQSQAKSVANITGLYSRELEKTLADEVDGPAIEVLRAFSEGKPLSPDDRELVAKFLFVQWKRVPIAKEHILKRLPKAEAAVKRELMEQISLAAASDPAIAMRAEEVKAQVLAVFDRRDDKDRTATWHQLVTQTTGPRVHDAIKSMNWVLVQTSDNEFLTCDNPMYFHAHEGLGREQSELTFPLSPSRALWATRHAIANGSTLTASANMTREINRRTAHNSARWIFASTSQRWIQPFLRKGSWKLTRLHPPSPERGRR